MPPRPSQDEEQPTAREGAAKAEQAIARQIGRRLREARQRRALSESHLANDLEVSVETLKAHEAGTIPLPAARMTIAAFLLDVPVGYFTDDEPPPLVVDDEPLTFADFIRNLPADWVPGVMQVIRILYRASPLRQAREQQAPWIPPDGKA